MIDNKKLDLTITRLTKSEDLPFDLLLLADETVAAIEKYIYDSGVYVVKTGAYPHPIAVFVLQKIDDNEIEIKNIAVAETFQDKGIGSYMIGEIKRIALAANYRRIIVGTP
ncbi:MAG TPA: GNAT family N-acetyltransferase, partial [Chitinophagaceae bacterium]|nr:GNAT family N-acetyltransferase [Chitinophagaceae bacterium]